MATINRHLGRRSLGGAHSCHLVVGKAISFEIGEAPVGIAERGAEGGRCPIGMDRFLLTSDALEGVAERYVKFGGLWCPADNVRTATVEPGRQQADKWNAASTYDLSVYGPNGLVRFFKGSVGSGAAVLDLVSKYDLREDSGSIEGDGYEPRRQRSRCYAAGRYRGESRTSHLQPGHSLENEVELEDFGGWYDLIATVAQDPTFNGRRAGHVETGRDSISDPAPGGVVILKE